MTHASEIAARVMEVPLLSPSAQRLVTIFGNAGHTLNDVLAVVDSDPGLTTSVLRVANSAALGLRTAITTTARAIAYMGDRIVMGIALGSCAAQMYNDPLEGYEAERGDLWHHCLQTAIAAREIAEFSRSECAPGTAYTAGLLHDIGKPIISAALKEFSRSPVPAINGNLRNNYLEWERQILGTDHCVVGALIAKHWNLPSALSFTMLHHHAPAEAPEEVRALAYTVHVGDMVAMMVGSGTGSDTLQYALDTRYSDYISLDESALERVLLNVRGEFDRISQMLEVLEQEPAA